MVFMLPQESQGQSGATTTDSGGDEDAAVVNFTLGMGHLLILLNSVGPGQIGEGSLGLAADDGSQSVGQQYQQDQQWAKVTLRRESAARVVQRIWARAGCLLMLERADWSWKFT